MKTMKIGFSRNNEDKIFSVLLQKYMNRSYSHCFVEYDTKEYLGDDAIYHSSLSAGIGYMSKVVFEESNDIVLMYEIEIPESIYYEIRESLFKVCGKKYGLMQNLGILIVDTARKLGIKMKNPLVEDENCSEMIYRHVLSILYPELKYDPNVITPRDVENILNKVGKRINNGI